MLHTQNSVPNSVGDAFQGLILVLDLFMKTKILVAAWLVKTQLQGAFPPPETVGGDLGSQPY